MKKKFLIIFSLMLVFTMLSCPYLNASVSDLITITDVPPKPVEGIKYKEIIGALQWGGYIIAIVMVAVIGIRYVLSGAVGKAKVKDTIVPWLIGAFIIATAVTITKVVFNFFTFE